MSVETAFETLREDLTIQSNASTPPPLAAIRVVQLMPGKADEFTRVMTSEFVPALKKAGVKDFWVYAGNFGRPQGRFVFIDPLAKFADIDRGNPLVRSGVLPAEDAAAINARLNALFTSSRVDIFRLVPDLSFGMPRRTTS